MAWRSLAAIEEEATPSTLQSTRVLMAWSVEFTVELTELVRAVLVEEAVTVVVVAPV